jgi:hypothetical protein
MAVSKKIVTNRGQGRLGNEMPDYRRLRPPLEPIMHQAHALQRQGEVLCLTSLLRLTGN